MWVVDFNTLNFLDVNMATLKHYGYTRQEFLSITLKDIRPIEEIPVLERAVAKRLKNINVYSTASAIHKKKNGEIINVEIKVAPIVYKGQKANVITATDITERTHYIKAIEDQNEQLKEISWIQSHIIRAPLTRIMGLIPLINESTDQADKAQMLEYLMLSAHELDDVIKDITDKAHKADYQFPKDQ